MMAVVLAELCCQFLSYFLVLAIFCGIVRAYFYACERSFILLYIELRCSAFADSPDLVSGKEKGHIFTSTF
jgi:hypothetical protein